MIVMSLQGLLGTYPFMVTEEMVNTFREMKRTRNIIFAEHKCLSGLPKIEHTGRNLDIINMQVIIHPIIADNLSVDARILLLRTMAQTGQEWPLVLGFSWFGFYCLRTVDVLHVVYHNGSSWSATVDLGLVEYN